MTSTELHPSFARPFTERRRRPRLVGETLGWLLPQSTPNIAGGRNLPDEEGGWEVRVHDVSRHGVGFVTTEPLSFGDRRRLRIGRGPAGRARAISVIVCRADDAGLYHIGAEFVGARSLQPAFAGRRLAKAG